MRRRELLVVMAGCAALSLMAVAWSWTHGAMLNYGDAVAHLHIARRVFDGRNATFTQLGSVWLPLPHILLMPLVGVYAWWANGVAGLIPSALAWLASCVGLYRLARHWLSPAAASLALAFFALNPNLLYMQTTAMTEPLFVCEMVWAADWLVEWRLSLDQPGEPGVTNRLTWLIALVLVAAVFTRYDGWIIALFAWCAMGIALLRRGRLASGTFWLASVLVVLAPVAWMTYNAMVFGDWLDFSRGPYSAKAIEIRTSSPGSGPPHPGWHNPWVSLIFFIKAAEMDAARLPWGNDLLILTVLGTAWGWLIARRRALAWSLVLWIPVPFYAYSVAFGSVPIFLPVWWPHSYYNTRYGLEMLPAFAIGLGFAASFVLAAVREWRPNWTRWAAYGMFAVIAINAAAMLHEKPIVFVESTKNIEARRAYDENIPAALRAALVGNPNAPVLMNTSVFPEIIASTGIPLRQTINEGDGDEYRAALASPAQHAGVVLAFQGDDIANAVNAHPEHLRAIAHFSTHGQPSATLYTADTARPGGISR